MGHCVFILSKDAIKESNFANVRFIDSRIYTSKFLNPQYISN